MKKIIVLGSLNMDLTIQSDAIPAKGETIHGYDFFTNPGGKGGNQAVASAKLGSDTEMIACVGDDMFGKEMISKLDSYGIKTSNVMISKDSSTGVAMIIRCENDNRIILGSGANYAITFEDVKSRFDKIANKGDIFLTQLENKYEVVIDSLKYAKEKGLYTVFNPAPARVLDKEVYKYIDLIVVNQSECQLLTGIYPDNEESYKKALHEFKERGCNAIITLGCDGSITLVDDVMFFVDSVHVDAVDTTAAGDSYIGALCNYLSEGKDLVEAMKYGAKVAAITVTRKGAQIAIPTKNEVAEFEKGLKL